MKHYVLDSFAILSLLQKEPGSDPLTALLRQAVESAVQISMSLINLGEVFYIIARRWGEEQTRITIANLETLPIKWVEADRSRILAAAAIKSHYSVSYADAFAATLTQEYEAILITGDPGFDAVADLIKVEWLPNKR